MEAIRLGAFELRRRVGSGGMGEVWLAEHALNGKPVAIKTIHLRQDDDQQMGHRFVAEVQAVARLSHPNIVGIHDFGVISERAAEHSLGVLQAHAPWFAMEFCADGDLISERPSNWRGMHHVLSSILEALALTHANGVLHRDLKPGNVLIARQPDGTLCYKLADFGLAWSQDRSADLNRSSQSVGTPNYMAPEQATGQLHAFGPATDLYALGCLAWNLACGSAPFTSFGQDATALMNAQVHAHPPQFRPRFALPRAVEHWIRRLLRKDPSDRYAVAAEALAELPGAGAHCDLNALPVEGSAENAAPTVQVQSVTPHHEPPAPPAPRTASRLSTFRSAPVTWPSWQQNEQTLRPEPGVGMGLVGLRSLPVVGLQSQRQQLWDALKETIAGSRQRLMFIEGAAGSGKSRLAMWLTRAAHQQGLAQYAMASFRGELEQGASLAAALAAHIGLDRGMTAQEALLVVASHLSRHRCDSVAARKAYLSAFDSVLSQLEIEESSSDELRRETLGELVKQLARAKPLILVLDDLLHDPSALEFVEYLLEQERCPCLIVATYRPDDLTRNEQNQGLHRVLIEREACSRVTTQALTAQECQDFTRSLLGLSADLTQRIAIGSKGSPETVRQLLMQLVEEDSLEVSEGGLDLKAGHQLRFLDSLTAVIAERTRRALDALSPDERRFLILGTLLGERVEISLQHQLCRRLGQRHSPGLVADLARGSMLALRRDSWGFVDATQRKMLLAYPEAQLDRAAYIAAAEVLEGSSRHMSLVYRWAAAHNRLAAGEALGKERMLELMTGTIASGRYQAAMRMGQDYLSLVEAPEHLEEATPCFEVRMAYNLCLYRLHRIEEGLADIDALSARWPNLPTALRHHVLTRRGLYLHPKFRQVIYEEMLEEGVAPELEVEIRPALARRCESKGRVSEALDHYDQALAAAAKLGEDAAFPILAKRSALAIAADRSREAEQDLLVCQRQRDAVEERARWSLERRWIEWLAANERDAEAWQRLEQQADTEQRSAGAVHPNTLELYLLLGALAGRLGAVRKAADEGLALGLEPFAEIFEAARVIGYGDDIPIEDLEALAHTVNAIPARYRLAQVIYLIGVELARRGQRDFAAATIRHAQARLAIYNNRSWVSRCDHALAELSPLDV